MVLRAGFGVSLLLFSACGGGEGDSFDTVEQAVGACAGPSMFLVGSPRNFGVQPGGPLAMQCSGGEWTVDEVFAGSGNVFAAGAFKFVQTGDFSTGPSWGDDELDGVADLGGDGNDIIVRTPGTYRVAFDDRSLRYTLTRRSSTCSEPSMFIRGSFNGWGQQEMFCIDDHRWAAIAMFISSSEEYKFDALGDWSRNFGDFGADGTADQDGWNIRAPGSGRNLVTFDEATGRYDLRQVSGACSRPTMFVRGGFNGWGALAMECENSHWAINIDGGDQGTEYKFDTFGDWRENWGDNDGDLRGDLNGRNIFVRGHHHLHFYNDGRYAYDTHQ